MSLAPGARLDGYEILGPLGSGGMGEVYRARDSVLKREAAIKVLPPFVSQDPDRLHRFQQEAQAAAALNHPNILAVFQFGTFEGSPYLVSELLEGDTLRQLLQRGPLAVRKAIDIGVQVAHGLAAAHDKGIVHRDLKPENLFVTKDGRVKILDFGLAKLTQRPPESGDTGPTLTHQGTDPGMILGTVGYMSPEQVRGHTADSRADIFAFGTVLYEMLAGKRAFQRSTSAETMTAILNEDPPSISQIVQSTPPGLQRVVHRCLEKNPEQRFQSASDLAFALEAISESGISGSVPTPASIQHRYRKPLLWSGGLVVILALATAAYFFARRPQHVPFEHYSIQKVIDSKHVRNVAISPDGAYLAAVEQDANGNQALWLHHIPTGSERPLVQEATYNYQDITFSPDGNYIYFRIDAVVIHSGNREDVYRIPVLGGQATRTLEGVDAPLSFIDGGQRVCFYRQNFTAGTYQFLSASAEGGDEQILANGKKPFLPVPVCTPNGRFAVFQDLLGFQILDFDSGRKKKMALPTTIGGWIADLHWAPDGKGLFGLRYAPAGSNKEIGFLSYPGGKWRQITNGLSDYWGLSLTADGRTIATRTADRNEKFGVLSLKDTAHIIDYQTEGLAWFTWLDNDRIVESSLTEGGLRIVDLVKNEKTSIVLPDTKLRSLYIRLFSVIRGKR
jgi:serine/threonine protein kinase